jgi:hypothetical protein
LLTYSSKTIAVGRDARNRNHVRTFAEIKDLLGEQPLVLDREFSSLEWWLNLVTERGHFVIRLKGEPLFVQGAHLRLASRFHLKT